MLALHLAAKFPPPIAKVSAALFAAPNAFNKAGADMFGTLVNGRIVNFDLDPVAQAPCTSVDMPSGWRRCGVEYPAIVFTGIGVDHYEKTPGLIEVELLRTKMTIQLNAVIVFYRFPSLLFWDLS